MRDRSLTAVTAALTLLALVVACERVSPNATTDRGEASTATSTPTGKLKQVKILIDWQPSAEYFGFFYAKATGLYASAGYNVEIEYGNGAPEVAKTVGVGAAAIGTTTSDNLVRQLADGGGFSRARALLKFNPAVVAALSPTDIRTLPDLKGKRLGTNPGASVYRQFLQAARTSTVEAFGVTEDPTIGWSGIPQLLDNSDRGVDAILAYTTNVVIDLELAGHAVNEIFLGENGIKSYGLVLIACSDECLQKNYGLTVDDIDKIFDLTSQAYAEGSKPSNIARSVDALIASDRGLKRAKIERGIAKIGALNSRINYPLGVVDEWLEGTGIPKTAREKALSLYR